MDEISQTAGGFCHAYYTTLIGRDYNKLVDFYGECFVSRGDMSQSFTTPSQDVSGEIKQFHEQYSQSLAHIQSVDAQAIQDGMLISVTGEFEGSDSNDSFVQTFILKTFEDDGWTAHIIVNDVLRIVSRYRKVASNPLPAPESPHIESLLEISIPDEGPVADSARDYVDEAQLLIEEKSDDAPAHPHPKAIVLPIKSSSERKKKRYNLPRSNPQTDQDMKPVTWAQLFRNGGDVQGLNPPLSVGTAPNVVSDSPARIKSSESSTDEAVPIEKTHQPHVQKDSFSFFVGNLPPTADSKSITEQFSKCGKVSRVTVKPDRRFAFVDFDMPQTEQQKVLNEAKSMAINIDGSYLKIAVRKAITTRKKRLDGPQQVALLSSGPNPKGSSIETNVGAKMAPISKTTAIITNGN